MPIFEYKQHKIYYEYEPACNQACITFLNGLLQHTQHWSSYQEYCHKHKLGTLSLDFPGQRRSSPISTNVTYTELASIVPALWKHLHIKTNYIVGLSLGAIIGLKIAIEFPKQVCGLITVGGESEKDNSIYEIRKKFLNTLNDGGIAKLYNLLASVNFSDTWNKTNKTKIQAGELLCAAANREEDIKKLLLMLLNETSFTKQLKNIVCPVMILSGNQDTYTPAWCQQILHKHITNSILITLNNAAHAIPIEYEEITQQLMLTFAKQPKNSTWFKKKTYNIDKTNDINDLDKILIN